MSDAAPQPSRAVPALLVGAALGLALAVWGLLENPRARGALPPGAVAVVNGTPVFEDGYRRLLAGFESDTRSPLTPELRRHVLDRMIDEELLVQRGLELGLAESDRRVRADLSDAVIRSVVALAEEEPPTAREVAAFYEAERAFFRQPGRARVAKVFVRAPGSASADEVRRARERAQRSRTRLLAGEPLARVRAEVGDEEVLTLPDALLPPAKLREYLGPTLAARVLELKAGAVSEPLQDAAGFHVFVVREREPARVPPLDEIREQVRGEHIRRAGDRALRAYLDELRRAADVRVREALFEAAPTP